MRLIKGVVAEPAVYKNGKTSIAIQSGGVTHRIYATGEYQPYFAFKVGDSVYLAVGFNGKPRLIEDTTAIAPAPSQSLNDYLAQQAEIYRAAYKTAKFTMGDLVGEEDLRAIATTLYLSAVKAGFAETPAPAADSIDLDQLPPAPRPTPRRVGRRSME